MFYLQLGSVLPEVDQFRAIFTFHTFQEQFQPQKNRFRYYCRLLLVGYCLYLWHVCMCVCVHVRVCNTCSPIIYTADQVNVGESMCVAKMAIS
jgi:hypothetical protein